MSLLKKLFGNAAESRGIISAPVQGQAIPLAELGDGVFSAGILGPGCGIRPEGESVFAPFNGRVEQVSDTRHAVALTSESGLELLIHVGLNTVEMGGEGFSAQVTAGESVRRGDLLLTFSRAAIAAAGHPDVVAVLLTNGEDYSTVEQVTAGTVRPGDPLLRVEGI